MSPLGYSGWPKRERPVAPEPKVRPVGPLGDPHVWRYLTDEEEARSGVPDPHSSQIRCDRCGHEICELCGTDDPGYVKVCAVPGKAFP